LDAACLDTFDQTPLALSTRAPSSFG